MAFGWLRSLLRRPAPTPRRRGLDAGATNRLLADWIYGRPKTADEAIANNRTVRGRSRHAAGNVGYAAQFCYMAEANILGPAGIRLQVRTADEAVNKAIETAWIGLRDRKITVDRRLCLADLEALALRTVLVDGELLVRKYRGFTGNPDRFAVQILDADLLDETFNRPAAEGRNEIRMGVEVDGFGGPVAYHVSRRLGSTDRERIPADEILHIYRSARANQTRGVSWLAASLVELHTLSRYEEAELFAARAAAAKMGFLTQENPALGPSLDAAAPAEAPSLTMDAQPGVIEQLPAGWKFSGWDPQHPTAGFVSFVQHLLRKVSGGWGVSYNAVGNDLERVNYSSLKGGLGLERDRWRILQAWWIREFCGPILAEWLGMALLAGSVPLPAGRTRDPRAYLPAARWVPRGWAWLEPLKEIQAANLAVGNALGSRTQYLAEQGLDFREVLEEIARETELARELGVALAATGAAAAAPTIPDEEDKKP